MSDLSQYLDLYLQTSREYLEYLNASLLKLEKNPQDKQSIEDIFRNAHSLKGQSAAMGFTSLGYLCHAIEDTFSEIKNEKLTLTSAIADTLFHCFDALTNSIDSIEKEHKEIDLSNETEDLKKLTGVTTEKAAAKITKQSATPISTPQPAISTAPQSGSAPEIAKNHDITTINVKVLVLDEMMSLLEELLVERLKFKNIVTDKQDPRLKNYFDTTQKLINALQYQITQARAIPLNLILDHFPRAVRDLGRAENKQVELVIEGGDLELDRTIVDRLDEPLIHIVRNAVSHGIQQKGTITISAKREKDYALISVSDNGNGIDWEEVAKKANVSPSSKNLKELLFSGISTSTEVTQISGRGVGLMAVKKMVEDFGGKIDVDGEKGKGTTFTIKLPLTLAIAKALLIKVGDKDYALPSIAVNRIVRVPNTAVRKVADQEFFISEKKEIPMIRMENILPDDVSENPHQKDPSETHFIAVILESKTDVLGLVIDKVVETTDIVMKPVPKVLKNIKVFSGVTILSNGKAALILNPFEIV